MIPLRLVEDPFIQRINDLVDQGWCLYLLGYVKHLHSDGTDSCVLRSIGFSKSGVPSLFQEIF
jgi:hypothetical protein